MGMFPKFRGEKETIIGNHVQIKLFWRLKFEVNLVVEMSSITPSLKDIVLEW